MPRIRLPRADGSLADFTPRAPVAWPTPLSSSVVPAPEKSREATTEPRIAGWLASIPPSRTPIRTCRPRPR